jgi:hypothetical protein
MVIVFAVSNAVLGESRALVEGTVTRLVDVESITVTDQALPRGWVQSGAVTDTAMGRIGWEQVELIPESSGVITNPIWTSGGFRILTQRDRVLKVWESPGGREWTEIATAVTVPGITIRSLTAAADGLSLTVEDAEGVATEHALGNLTAGAQEAGPDAAGIATFAGRRLELSTDTPDGPISQPTATVARTRTSDGPWQRLDGVGGTHTFGEGVTAGPAGWGLTWHQCDPGCGQEVWLSSDLVTWDRIRISNSVRDEIFFIASGIGLGADSVVISGVAWESSPYTGSAAGVVWVGTIEQPPSSPAR